MTTSFRSNSRNRRSRFTQPTATEPGVQPTDPNSPEVEAYKNRSQMVRDIRDNGIGGAFIAACTAPAKLMGWLTSNRGGKAIVGILALYCAGLSVEAWYVTLPRVAGQRTEENRKFMPKPFIDDGADLGLLNPLNAVPAIWDMAMGVFESMLPFVIKGAAPAPVRCVWLDWRFYIALLVSVSLQLWQAKALRSLSIDARRLKAHELSQYKRMALDPKSLDIANVKVAEYNQSLMGKRRTNGAMIFLSYLVELGTGFASITGSRGVGILTAGVYCIIQAFGFEVMMNQLDDE
ncbi:MAG: hypothetical protein LH679_03370 [Cyanobacteria bacterium CAN_BIN43]|nr:hypothetical protein [Cyanobacteria bacterium CAN_BIN43]